VHIKTINSFIKHPSIDYIETVSDNNNINLKRLHMMMHSSTAKMSTQGFYDTKYPLAWRTRRATPYVAQAQRYNGDESSSEVCEIWWHLTQGRCSRPTMSTCVCRDSVQELEQLSLQWQSSFPQYP